MITDEIKRDKRKGSFMLSSLSDGLRTPLNGIISYTQLLLQTNLTTVQKEYLKSMNKCCLQLMELLNDILDYSKLCIGKMKLNYEKFKIKHVVDVVNTTLKELLKNKQQTCSYVISRNIPKYIVSDKQKIIQVLINLISNSNKFTEPGGCIIIHISPKAHNLIEFTVKDTGIGITQENQATIFNAFYQGTSDDSLVYAKKGFGLGLTISKQLVELMEGTIHVNSEYGKGTTMVFTILNKMNL